MQQDISRSELEAIYKVMDPSGLQKKDGLKESFNTEEKSFRSNATPISKVQLTQLRDSSSTSENLVVTNDSMHNVKVRLDIILGRNQITLAKLLELKSGNTIILDKLAGEPVDIELNGVVIAKGEVIVIEDNFGVYITHLSQFPK